MNSWKCTLTDAWRCASWPWRRAVLRQRKRNNTVPLSVLFYHRVANDFPNPWTISEAAFQQQIDWLQQNFDLISLAEVQRRMRQGNARPAVAITFDDGYSDNCNFAMQLLVERGIPVTYFVTTLHTTQHRPFQHDLSRNEPLPTNSIESLKTLARAGVEIGGHSRTHADLGKLSDEALIFDEVIAATREMESLLDTRIRYFAFPFGQRENLNPRVFRLLREHGFAGVCSTLPEFNNIGDDDFHLVRIHGDPSFARIRNWLTFDPRLSRGVRYDWQRELELWLAETGNETADAYPLDARQLESDLSQPVGVPSVGSES